MKNKSENLNILFDTLDLKNNSQLFIERQIFLTKQNTSQFLNYNKMYKQFILKSSTQSNYCSPKSTYRHILIHRKVIIKVDINNVLTIYIQVWHFRFCIKKFNIYSYKYIKSSNSIFRKHGLFDHAEYFIPTTTCTTNDNTIYYTYWVFLKRG